MGAVSEHTSQVHDAHANTQSRPQYLEYTAGASQGPLGLKLQWPPGPVIIQAVVKGGWAESSGLEKGAEVIAVNGKVVASMEEAELRDLLKQRPLCIALPLPATAEAEAEAEALLAPPSEAKGGTSVPEVGIDRV